MNNNLSNAKTISKKFYTWQKAKVIEKYKSTFESVGKPKVAAALTQRWTGISMFTFRNWIKPSVSNLILKMAKERRFKHRKRICYQTPYSEALLLVESVLIKEDPKFSK